MKLEVDLHTHTIASGHAYSTVQEIAEAAREKGIKVVGITDHGPALPGAAHLYHFWNLRVIPLELSGVRVLKGAEANILNVEGEIDLPTEILEMLDVVGVGLHPRCGYEETSEEKNTQAVINAMSNPWVQILVHPGNPNYPLNIDRVVEAAKKSKVILEINNGSFFTRQGSYDSCFAFARAAYEAGLDVIMGSDAHLASAVGQFDHALELVEKAGFTEERIFNSSAERVLDFLKSKKEEALAKVGHSSDGKR